MVTATIPTYRLISDHSFAAVRQNIANDQKAFFAQRRYEAGEILSRFSAGEVHDKPSYLTVQVGINRHIMLQPEHLQYINHSCEPNVFFDTHSMEVIAVQRIEEGDELTFFYPSTEWDMAQPFNCTCGTKSCLGEIKGAAHIEPSVIETYRLTNFIQQQLHDRSNRQ